MSQEITTMQAAKLLGVGRSRVQQFVSDGRLKAVRRIGTADLFLASDVKQFARSAHRDLRPVATKKKSRLRA